MTYPTPRDEYLLRENEELRAEVARLTVERDEAQAELDDWRATPPAELQGKTEAALRAEVELANEAGKFGTAVSQALQELLDEAEAKLARQQPVIEAAKAVLLVTGSDSPASPIEKLRTTVDALEVSP